jgi:hypothetical protein
MFLSFLLFQEMVTGDLPFSEFSQFIRSTTMELSIEEMQDTEHCKALESEGWIITGNTKVREVFDVQQIKAAIINVNKEKISCVYIFTGQFTSNNSRKLSHKNPRNN